MTDNEIVKALKELFELMLCEGDLQRSATVSKAFYLIKRQQAEIVMEQKHADCLNAEIERLQKQIVFEVESAYDRGKIAGVKEFAERFNKEAEKVVIDREGDFVEMDDKIYDTVANWCKATSDNLLKEMEGENDE